MRFNNPTFLYNSRALRSRRSQNTNLNGLLVAQQSANCFPSHVEKLDVKVHDVVEVVPLAAMPKMQTHAQSLHKSTKKRCIFIYLLAHGSHVLPGGS